MSKQSRSETALSSPYKEQLQIQRMFLAESLAESLARRHRNENERKVNLQEEKMMLKALENQEKDHKALLQDMHYKQRNMMEKVNRNILKELIIRVISLRTPQEVKTNSSCWK